MQALKTILATRISDRSEEELAGLMVEMPIIIPLLLDFLFPSGSRIYVPYGEFPRAMISAALMSGKQSIILPSDSGMRGNPTPRPESIVMIKGVLDNDFDPHQEWMRLLPHLSMEKKDFKKVEVRAVLDERTLRPPSESSLEATQFVRIEALL